MSNLASLRTPRALRPAFGLRDLTAEVVAGLLARPGRSVLTVAGTVIGIAALVATLGLSKTAGSQIVGRFDALAATQVTAEPAQNSTFASTTRPTLPWDVEDRIGRLRGVAAVGAWGDVDTGGSQVRAVDIEDRTGRTSVQMHVVAVTPGILTAVRGTIRAGRWFDEGYSRDAARVVVLGKSAAARLNITRVDNQPAVYIGQDLYVVVGIVDSVSREPDLLNALWMPVGTARDRFKADSPSRIVIETSIGAAGLIARQTAVALSPNDPTLVRVIAPPEPRKVKQNVQNDVDGLFLLLGVLSLVVGAIGIANVTLVTVLERVGEIGLRRALGATRGHIAGQFLVESVAMGFAGGVIGTSAGILVVTGTALAQRWAPVLDAWIPLAAPLLGAFVGLVAGCYPAMRAAALEPVEALRAGA